MSRKRCVMGIDPSLSGFAVVVMFEDGTTVEREIKTSVAKTLSSRMKRLRKIAALAEEMVKEHVPELCLIEGYAFGAKGRATLSLAELGGIVRDKIIDYPDVTVEIPPTTLKKFLTGRGNSPKIDVVQKLARRFEREFKTDNLADAFGLAYMAAVVLEFRSAVSQYERDAAGFVRIQIQQET